LNHIETNIAIKEKDIMTTDTNNQVPEEPKKKRGRPKKVKKDIAPPKPEDDVPLYPPDDPEEITEL
jgi:hypothetical protein